MVRKILLYFFMPCLILAFVLSFFGITEVGQGQAYTLWLQSVNSRFNGWGIQIPDIPKIPKLSSYEEVNRSISRVVTVPVVNGGGTRWTGVFSWFRTLVNFLIDVVNGFTTVINVLILVINIVLQVVEFIISLIIGIKDLPHYIQTYGTSVNSIWWYQNIH